MSHAGQLTEARTTIDAVQLFIFTNLGPWYTALHQVATAVRSQDGAAALSAYQTLFQALTRSKAPSLLDAAADDLLRQDSIMSEQLSETGTLAKAIYDAALVDLGQLFDLLAQDWSQQVSQLCAKALPSLDDLHPKASPDNLLREYPDPQALLKQLILTYQKHGTGVLARYQAFRWSKRQLSGIEHPVQFSLERLHGLERNITRLRNNTEAFLAGKPAQHSLLYGPRGSGKSSAVRALLHHYADQGLRLIEVQIPELPELPLLTEVLRHRPHKYLIFVDDLSFESQDSSYHPLKTVLEGSLTAKAANMLIYATSNRRHLVKEQFKDRPDPLDDDVHAWDSQHERLALADRFGLTLTFPSPSQKHYLSIVQQLAKMDGLNLEDLETRAVQFAEWGNGYSGRTAQQFIDAVHAGLV